MANSTEEKDNIEADEPDLKTTGEFSPVLLRKVKEIEEADLSLEDIENIATPYYNYALEAIASQLIALLSKDLPEVNTDLSRVHVLFTELKSIIQSKNFVLVTKEMNQHELKNIEADLLIIPSITGSKMRSGIDDKNLLHFRSSIFRVNNFLDLLVAPHNQHVLNLNTLLEKRFNTLKLIGLPSSIVYSTGLKPELFNVIKLHPSLDVRIIIRAINEVFTNSLKYKASQLGLEVTMTRGHLVLVFKDDKTEPFTFDSSRFSSQNGLKKIRESGVNVAFLSFNRGMESTTILSFPFLFEQEH